LAGGGGVVRIVISDCPGGAACGHVCGVGVLPDERIVLHVCVVDKVMVASEWALGFWGCGGVGVPPQVGGGEDVVGSWTPVVW
jgi:hypothetical protein